MSDPIIPEGHEPQARYAIGYMCMTDFEDELGMTAVRVYSSENELRRARKCVKECGIVKVRVEWEETIQPSKFGV